MEKTVTASLVKSGTFFFPEAISKLAETPDDLFNFILWASIFTFAGLIVATAYLLMSGRYKTKHEVPKNQVTHNTKLELVWTILPTVLVMVIFYWGFIDFLKMKTPPEDALDVRVTARKWMWEFEYKNGRKTLGELVVPLDKPIRLTMSSEDVLHSFFVPNLRMKRDVIPNRYTTIWLQSEKLGNYQIFCTEYCGDGHSNMLATFRVLSADAYEKWLAGDSENANTPLPELGKKLYTAKGCNACHTVDGSAAIGPTWKGLFGHNVPLNTGGSAMADDNYLRRSITEPAAQVVRGFQPVMPTYSGMLSDREINAIIEFIKTLK